MRSERVINFGPGPAILPEVVLEQIRSELLNFRGEGASIIEISHRSKAFVDLLGETEQRYRRLANVPQSHKILYIAGGARMVFSAIPLNLMGLKPKGVALYTDTGLFANLAAEEAARYGEVKIVASSKAGGYSTIPELDVKSLDAEASYLHITSNNTVFGTAWPSYPKPTQIPLIVDATSDVLSRPIDYSEIGALYAGLQKNLGPSGLAVVVIKEKLLGKARAETPLLLNFFEQAQQNSLINTINTFAVYVMSLMLHWIEDQGGVGVIAAQNQAKAKLLYDIIDNLGYYKGVAAPPYRSIMNVTFRLPSPEAEKRFLAEADKAGLYALAGHRAVGGVRASLYNAMPLAGVKVLADFMTHFAKVAS